MTRSQMIEHLGTIAKSGSKSFIDEVSQQPAEMAANNIIGTVAFSSVLALLPFAFLTYLHLLPCI